ncbi:helix-turn-helix domain-containing protein [Zavarzinella formosa]|uniref:helix-turn-helix domain-containing protein n=1 Tax=Zavarzinella formosa TaxID=360055 RepID=UPI0012F997C9|nr:helix-turn-helix transcriptional regulator [Zavarzinella formosa]
MKFTERLKTLRKEFKMSQPKLAEASGVPVGSIRSMERGKRRPRLTNLLRLSRVLGGSMSIWDGLELEPDKQEAKAAAPVVAGFKSH